MWKKKLESETQSKRVERCLREKLIIIKENDPFFFNIRIEQSKHELSY